MPESAVIKFLNKAFQNIVKSAVFLFLISSCTKSKGEIEPIIHSNGTDARFVNYTIRAGQQYCDQQVYKQTNYSALKFTVQFDSSAIYQTISPDNQYDINKLYGFSDNNEEHHQFSARFGWRWSEGALRLFGYVYNKGVMSFEELGTISIGAEHSCSIKVLADKYIFTLNNISKNLPRASLTATALGYQLYPYFGGDETAPHDMMIRIKQL